MGEHKHFAVVLYRCIVGPRLYHQYLSSDNAKRSSSSQDPTINVSIIDLYNTIQYIVYYVLTIISNSI